MVRGFAEYGTATQAGQIHVGTQPLPLFVNEFWTSKQRAAHSIQEVSYRACFKPQLPRFFIDRLTEPGELVLDPFMGRGTTLVESVLRGRRAAGCDVNPLAAIMCGPRLCPPELEAVRERLEALTLDGDFDLPDDLLVFYHPDTLREIMALRRHFQEQDGPLDATDAWIRMVATNRLTGHSPGFFSVYTMPPNQAVTADRQRIINEKRAQAPVYRDVKAIILKKSKALLRDWSGPDRANADAHGALSTLFTGPSDAIKGIRAGSVSLVVTSPPFLDAVDYAKDNWLRCWFNHIDAGSIPIWMFRKIEDWQAAMTRTFKCLHKLLKDGGHIAFEVGEVRNGTVRLEEYVIPAAEAAGLKPLLVLINDQEFTKTSNCWGVENRKRGTNTNRIVLLRK